jgi:predicted acyl esterase
MKNSNYRNGMVVIIAILFVGSSLLSIGSAQKVSITNIENRDNDILAPVIKPLFTKETFMVEMRDGIHLATDVFLPDGGSPPHGAILIRTPYNKNDSGDLYMWANNGWPSIIQDCRGRFQSEGIDTMFRDAHTDGPDTLDWIASQNWSNGKVGTIGGSATGIVQYLMAGPGPDPLTCQYIGAATPNLYTTIYPGGQFRKHMVESWLQKQGSTYILPELWSRENYSLQYWTNVSLEDNWQDVNVPAVHLGGWYDCFCQGLLDGFMGYQYNGGTGAVGKSKLIVGPWTHALFGWSRIQGELKYPENSLDTFSEEYWDEILEQYILEESNDFENRYNVVYYVMGDVTDINAFGNFWRYADDWPPQYIEDEWYFHEDNYLSMDSPESFDSLTYNYNPLNPVPTKGGTNLDPFSPTWAGPYDQRAVENRDDVLLFTSDELTEPYEATGPIKARLYVSSNCPDTDFTVKLTDVYPDGRSMLICDGILRMRNRDGFDHWEFMEPGEIYEVEVDLWSTSYIWNTGHKIRVAISSSNYPRFLANPNTRDGMNQNTDTNIAENSLYLDSSHPSCIILPRYNDNYAPIRPKITGPNKGIPEVSYSFIFNSTDPEGEDVYFYVDWGDGTNSNWIGPYGSGEEVTLEHTWSTTKIYTIKAKAKDVNDDECEFSNHNINIPRSRPIFNSFVYRLMERFPNLFPTLRHLLENI